VSVFLVNYLPFACSGEQYAGVIPFALTMMDSLPPAGT